MGKGISIFDHQTCTWECHMSRNVAPPQRVAFKNTVLGHFILNTYPLVISHSYWKWSFIISWITYYKWWFSIAMLVYQRVLYQEKTILSGRQPLTSWRFIRPSNYRSIMTPRWNPTSISIYISIIKQNDIT